MASNNPGAGKTVLVTGASGYVGAELLNSLLSRGYNVKAAVRNDASADKIKKSHGKYANQLSFAIVKDLQTPGAHDEAVKGVEGVFHLASPFVLEVKDNATDLLDPAINGTVELLKSIHKNNPNVKRVVLTSSFASILDMSKGNRPGYVYTEADWNPCTYEEAADSNTPGGVSYCASKALAEKAAWDYIRDNAPTFSMTAMCPPMVYGPSSTLFPGFAHLNTSSADIYRLFNGSSKEVPETAFFGWVDVRDLAEAEVRAYESEMAAGQRYLTASSGFTHQQIVDIIREEFPEKRDSTPVGRANEAFPVVYHPSNEKVKRELGLEFRKLRTTIVDMVNQMIGYEKEAGQA
ncbi:hypothetical protein HYFRA_00004220 [Hymenoscyphus fraxineus]|uniref:NAD-dependent epimerase/dehydratase domain-containing protein n=1 Tax=Hymenoscyphus fraxineus TaxID=746836 RepID=A0A9N9KPV8_9HELO|nr:hypothetical protein HYFRA_00004220 [Hymenoscyphus fraxineus]